MGPALAEAAEAGEAKDAGSGEATSEAASLRLSPGNRRWIGDESFRIQAPGCWG